MKTNAMQRFISGVTSVIKGRKVLTWQDPIWYIISEFYQHSKDIFPLNSKFANYPLWCRPNSSDFWVFKQIYIELVYSCLNKLQDVDLIVDCGANIGFSSAYFLSQFPQCKVVAIEPEPGNFAMLQRNLASYKDRVELVQSGIWSSKTDITMSEEKYRDGMEWSKQVRKSKPGDLQPITAVDIPTILEIANCERISLLKIDIEGAEGVLFAADNCQKWLSKVDAISIELHDDTVFGPCSRIFFNAIAEQDFEVTRSGELTICKRPKPIRSYIQSSPTSLSLTH